MGKEIPEKISIPVWWKNGGMMYRRDCLPLDHPEHTYNYIKREFGVDPELFGVEKPPFTTVCPHCGHEFVDDKHNNLEKKQFFLDNEPF